MRYQYGKRVRVLSGVYFGVLGTICGYRKDSTFVLPHYLVALDNGKDRHYLPEQLEAV